MNTLSTVFIQWSNGQKAIETMGKFNSLRETSFPNVIGTVDGYHIAILALWKKRSVMPKLDINKSFYTKKRSQGMIVLYKTKYNIT